MNGSTGPKSGSPSSSGPDPLDRMREAIHDARDARRLLEYSSDFDEPTGRTDVHVHLPQPSQPELSIEAETPETPKTGILHVTLTVVRKFPPWGAVLVAVAAIVVGAYVYLRLHGME